MLSYQAYNHQKEHWIICLHAVCTGSFVFNSQMKILRRNFNVLTIDLPGHFRSKEIKLKNPDTALEETTQEVFKILDELGIKKAYFLGVSLGTAVIHAILSLEPERVYKVCLVGTYLGFRKSGHFILKRFNLVSKNLSYKLFLRLFSFLLMPFKNQQKVNKTIYEKGKILGKENFIFWLKAIDKIPDYLEQKKINEMKISRMYISGEKDYMILPVLLKKIKKNEYTSINIMKDCGHMCNMEKPAEFNQLMMDFLLKEGEKN